MITCKNCGKEIEWSLDFQTWRHISGPGTYGMFSCIINNVVCGLKAEPESQEPAK